MLECGIASNLVGSQCNITSKKSLLLDPRTRDNEMNITMPDYKDHLTKQELHSHVCKTTCIVINDTRGMHGQQS